LPEQKINKRRNANETGDPGIGKRLKVFVVGLLNTEHAVPRVVFCEGHAKRVKPGAKYWLVEKNFKRNLPKMSAAIADAVLYPRDADAPKELVISAK